MPKCIISQLLSQFRIFKRYCVKVMLFSSNSRTDNFHKPTIIYVVVESKSTPRLRNLNQSHATHENCLLPFGSRDLLALECKHHPRVNLTSDNGP